MSSPANTLETTFPTAVPAADFVTRTKQELAILGFGADNTIACVGTCRDELCVPLRRLVQDAWGEAFNFSSLAGMLLLGTSGFGAAHAHAPIVYGRERYLYVAMPHIGIGEDGALGRALRLGREGSSDMCGALSRIRGELGEGPLRTDPDPDDPELGLVRQKLAPHLAEGQVPDLLSLTRLTLSIIERDLAHMIELTVDTGGADYAILTGIQIHLPDGGTYVEPSLKQSCVQGTLRPL